MNHKYVLLKSNHENENITKNRSETFYRVSSPKIIAFLINYFTKVIYFYIVSKYSVYL